jgi:hypothetical protein
MYSNVKVTKSYYVPPPIPAITIFITISDVIGNSFIDEANVLLQHYNNNDIISFTDEINTTYSNLLINYPTYASNARANTTVHLINGIYNLFLKSKFIIDDVMINPFIYEANILLEYYKSNNITSFTNEINTTYSNLLTMYPNYASDIKSNTAVQLINSLYNLFTQSRFIINGVMVDPFIYEASILLHYYDTNNSTLFHNEIDTTYSKLKLTTNYINNVISHTAVQLIDGVNTLFITNHDLQEQLGILEEELIIKLNSKQIAIDSLFVVQNTNFKLLYLQYLLMYDIKLTNGLFIDTYLNNAQKVLDSNNGILKHFIKVVPIPFEYDYKFLINISSFVGNITSIFETATYTHQTSHTDINLTLNTSLTFNNWNDNFENKPIVTIGMGKSVKHFDSLQPDVLDSIGDRLLEVIAHKLFGYGQTRAAINNDSEFYTHDAQIWDHLSNSVTLPNIQMDIFNKYVDIGRYENEVLNHPQSSYGTTVNFNFDGFTFDYPLIMSGNILTEATLTEEEMSLVKDGTNVGGSTIINGAYNIPILISFY